VRISPCCGDADAERSGEARQGAKGQVLLPDLHSTDVDGRHAEGLGKLVLGAPAFRPKLRDSSADIRNDGVKIVGLHDQHRRRATASHIVTDELLI
jgi:hypothetical protein